MLASSFHLLEHVWCVPAVLLLRLVYLHCAGTYSNLPSAVHDMRGPMPAQEQEQQRLLNQLNHLLYANLLKV